MDRQTSEWGRGCIKKGKAKCKSKLPNVARPPRPVTPRKMEPLSLLSMLNAKAHGRNDATVVIDCIDNTEKCLIAKYQRDGDVLQLGLGSRTHPCDYGWFKVEVGPLVLGYGGHNKPVGAGATDPKVDGYDPDRFVTRSVDRGLTVQDAFWYYTKNDVQERRYGSPTFTEGFCDPGLSDESEIDTATFKTIIGVRKMTGAHIVTALWKQAFPDLKPNYIIRETVINRGAQFAMVNAAAQKLDNSGVMEEKAATAFLSPQTRSLKCVKDERGDDEEVTWDAWKPEADAKLMKTAREYIDLPNDAHTANGAYYFKFNSLSGSCRKPWGSAIGDRPSKGQCPSMLTATDNAYIGEFFDNTDNGKMTKWIMKEMDLKITSQGVEALIADSFHFTYMGPCPAINAIVINVS